MPSDNLPAAVAHIVNRATDFIFDEAEKDAADRRRHDAAAAKRIEQANAAARRAEAKGDKDWEATVNAHRRLTAVLPDPPDIRQARGDVVAELQRIMTTLLESHDGRVDLSTLQGVWEPFLEGHLIGTGWPSGNSAKVVVIGTFAMLLDALDATD